MSRACARGGNRCQRRWWLRREAGTSGGARGRTWIWKVAQGSAGDEQKEAGKRRRQSLINAAIAILLLARLCGLERGRMAAKALFCDVATKRSALQAMEIERHFWRNNRNNRSVPLYVVPLYVIFRGANRGPRSGPFWRTKQLDSQFQNAKDRVPL